MTGPGSVLDLAEITGNLEIHAGTCRAARRRQLFQTYRWEKTMSATESAKTAGDCSCTAPPDGAPDAQMAAGEKEFVQVHSATVRFAGDSGDGMQVVGSQFADIASMTGLVVCTQPDYPSEIRAPAGSLGGVSGFQLSFADHEVHTPGDSPYVLIAMNPAALKVNLRDVQPGGILVVNEDEFTEANLTKAGYAANPLTSGELSAYRVVPVGMTRMNEEAVRHLQLPRKDAARCKNFFALGLSLWLVRSADPAGAGVPHQEVPQKPLDHGRQRRQPAGRIQLCRHGRTVPRAAYGGPGASCPKGAIAA